MATFCGVSASRFVSNVLGYPFAVLVLPVPTRIIDQALVLPVAKQLAAINFLREVMGTRKHDLEPFIANIARFTKDPAAAKAYAISQQSRCGGDEEEAGEGSQEVKRKFPAALSVSWSNFA